MENLQIHSELISLEEQLETLKNAREMVIRDDGLGVVFGLCVIISESLPVRFLGYSRIGKSLKDLIPLFTCRNAIRYFKGKGYAYWWPRFINGKPNIAPRLAMIDWMESLIKEEINKQK